MSRKIIICDECEGYGKIQKDELTDYHKNEKDYWDEKCNKCNGHGRLLKIKEVKIHSQKLKDVLIVKSITVRKLNEKDVSIKERGVI